MNEEEIREEAGRAPTKKGLSLHLFNDRFVGLAFAAAFGLWAWYLNSLASTVLEGVKEIKQDNAAIRSAMDSMSNELASHRLAESEAIAVIRERQNNVIRRVEELESHK